MSWAAYLLTLLVLLCFAVLRPSVAAIGAVSALIVLPLLSWALLWLVKKRLRIELTAPATAQKGEEIPIGARLTGDGLLPLGRLELTVCVTNSITGQSLRRKTTCDALSRWKLQSDFCGCLYIRVERARLYDLMGLLWVNVKLPKEKRVVIMPDTFPVLIGRETFPAPVDDCEDYAPDRKGQDRTETYQIRNYVPGDSLAQIHWKLSSKLDQLMVRDPGCPMDQNLMVFVDRGWGSITPEQADAMMETAVSICQSLCEEAIPFQLVWNEETIQTQNVTDPDQLPEAVSALLKSKTPPPEPSGAEVYLGLHGPVRMSRLIFLGTALPERLEELAGQAHVVSLICGDGGQDDGVIFFTPETYEDVLAQVSWS